MHDILSLPRATDFPVPRRKRRMVLQVNLGDCCNRHCAHRQVNVGPRPTGPMDGANMERNLVDRQPAMGMFGRGRAGLRRLDGVGYGQPGSRLTLNLPSRDGALAEDLTERAA
jgi:hypothetical protein